jgi:Flp pilus assembly protein TadG
MIRKLKIRRGIVAVEAAVILPIVVLMFGLMFTLGLAVETRLVLREAVCSYAIGIQSGQSSEDAAAFSRKVLDTVHGVLEVKPGSVVATSSVSFMAHTLALRCESPLPVQP